MPGNLHRTTAPAPWRPGTRPSMSGSGARTPRGPGRFCWKRTCTGPDCCNRLRSRCRAPVAHKPSRAKRASAAHRTSRAGGGPLSEPRNRTQAPPGHRSLLGEVKRSARQRWRIGYTLLVERCLGRQSVAGLQGDGAGHSRQRIDSYTILIAPIWFIYGPATCLWRPIT